MHIFLSILENVLLVLNVAVAIYGIYFLALGIMCLFFRPKKSHSDQINRFALVIAARNEREIIGNLIDSLKKLDYPKDMYDIYVVPNNCTDDTEEVARADVYKRQVKGYGHGVGMSQQGANYMAKNGYLYKDILTKYYTGTEIVKKS